jgi:hypothetical protein
MQLHHQEVISPLSSSPADDKAALLEAPLRSDIPFQGIQENPVNTGIIEDMANQGGHGVRPVALTPVPTVTDNYTQLRLLSVVIYVIIHTVPNMLAIIKAVDGKPPSLPARMLQLVSVNSSA